MAKQYYVKKDPSTNGPYIEWTALSGREFYRLITSPEGKDRFFIDMDDFMIEASKDEYIEWRREKDHSDYLREQAEGHPVLSIYSDSIAEARNGEELIPDESVNVEADVLRSLDKSELRSALTALDTASYRLLHALYLSDHPQTLRQFNQKSGIPVMTLQDRKRKLLDLLSQKIQNKKF